MSKLSANSYSNAHRKWRIVKTAFQGRCHYTYAVNEDLIVAWKGTSTETVFHNLLYLHYNCM